MMGAIEEGDMVDFTVQGALVVDFDPVVRLLVATYGLQRDTVELKVNEGVTIEAGTPLWWPPREGDLLVDGAGRRWFGVGAGSNVTLIGVGGESLTQQETWEARRELRLKDRKK